MIAEGEVMQLVAMNNAQISEDGYLDIIDAKTAALFAAAAEVGGVIADAQDAEQKALTAYGRNLGIAFQLVDDALDYGSINCVLGKIPAKILPKAKSLCRSFWPIIAVMQKPGNFGKKR